MSAQDEIEALRTATREAHEVIKDLRAATREARGVITEIEEAAKKDVDERLNVAVQAGLVEFGKQLEVAIEDASARVDKRFDTIADILLGETKAGRRKGKPSLAELAQHVVETRDT